MARLVVHVEGQTEEAFVHGLLAPHLYSVGYHQVWPVLIGNARRGGIVAWEDAKKDIVNHLKHDKGCFATTMVDYYGMPTTGGRAWPGRATSNSKPFEEKAVTVEKEVKASICAELGLGIEQCRFVPFVLMHEYEGLLFSDCDAFGHAIKRPDVVDQLQAIRNGFSTPEEINDSSTAAPSKRIAEVVRGYQKPTMGVLGAQGIGLAKIRQECPHFDAWLEVLEAWPNSDP